MVSARKDLKALPCIFDDDFVCSYLKVRRVMERCFKCCHFKRSMDEALEVDERVMDEIDEIRRTGVCE